MKSKKTEIYGKKSILSSAILAALGSANAATIEVDGVCTLIDAIQAANTDLAVGSCTAGSGADVIQVVTPNSGITINTIFEPSGSGPGNAGLPVITSEVTLEGNNLTIQADNSTDDFRLFDVADTGDFTLRDTTVSGADDGYGVGSGLFSAGRTTIENSTFAGNNGAVLFYGGYGNELTDSVIRHNFNNSAYAAGVQTFYAGVEISRSSIFENHNDSSGGVNASGVGAGPTIAGGLGLLQSEVSISDSTISGNSSVYGGGIIVQDVAPAPLPGLSTMFEQSPLRGIIGSELTISNSTITNNKSRIAAGILQYGYQSKINLQGTIVAGNETYAQGYAAEGYLFNPSYFYGGANNIIGENGTVDFGNLVLSGNDVSFSNDATDNLYPLTSSNGQFMHPLKVGSVAIDGNDVSCFGSLFDQDGKGRGIDGDDNGSFICDVGAFEHSLPMVADDAPCSLSNAIISANSDASVGGCQPGNGHDIILLPENSTQSLATVQSYLSVNPAVPFGLPAITTGVTIEGNGSSIERDAAAVDDFDLFLVESQGQLNLLDANLTGSTGVISAILTFNANVNLIDSQITGNDVAGLVDFYSVNSSVVGSYIGNNNLINGFASYYSAVSSSYGVGFGLSKSTVSNNTAASVAGVIIRGSNSSVINSTISGNTADMVGGLAFIDYAPTQSAIIHSTISNNEGGLAGGVYAVTDSPDSMVLNHNIISGNTLTPPPPGVELKPLVEGRTITPLGGGPQPVEMYATPTIELDGFNVFGRNGNSGVAGQLIGASDVIPTGATSTVIEPLANNGGITPTHLPVQSGDAVDLGTPFCLEKTDQLDRIRPWNGASSGTPLCDAGAIELNSVAESDLIFKDGFDPLIILRRTLK